MKYFINPTLAKLKYQREVFGDIWNKKCINLEINVKPYQYAHHL